MIIDKSLFIGKIVKEIRLDKEAQEWVFNFSDDVFVRISTPWRIINNEQILQTSGDEGQIYGLPQPVNVSKNVMNILKDKKITGFANDTITADLTFEFEGNLKIQTFGDSAGYEPWKMYFKNGLEYVAQGSGKIFKMSE